MIQLTNSKMRLIAACKLMNEGHSMEYSAGVYSIPVKTFEAYLGGLSNNALTDLSEIKERSTTVPKTFEVPFGGVFEDMGLNKEPDWSKHNGFKKGETTIIGRPCPYPNSGHLPVGGVQKHSAGDIFPYIIVLTGDLEHPDYNLIGNGFKMGDCIWGLYKSAHKYATELLNPLLTKES